MAQLEAIVRLQPKNREAWMALANGWLAVKRWPQAEQTYREIARRWPKDHLGWQGLAAAQYHQGRFEEAAMAARQAVTLQPQSPGDRLMLASSLLEYAMQYPQPQLHSAALDWSRREFEALVPALHNPGDLYLRLGRICIATRDTAAAVAYLEKASALLPGRADISLFLAKAYTQSRNEPAARKALEQGLQQHPDSADLCDGLGQLVQNSGAPDADQQALSLFQKAVQLAPRNERFQERLGAAYLRANHLNEAEQTFESAAQLAPSRAFPYQQLAAVYARLRDPKRAAAAAKQSETLTLNAQQLSHLEAIANTHPKDVALHLSLADRYRAIGERGAARNEYLAMLQIDPQNAHARESLTALDSAPAEKTAVLTTNAAPH
jgi:tetratricopeptide (TPR) repeat protein